MVTQSACSGTFPFLKLPLELRQLIYGLLCPSFYKSDLTMGLHPLIGHPYQPAILQSCKKIYGEASKVLYHAITFSRFESDSILHERAWTRLTIQIQAYRFCFDDMAASVRHLNLRKTHVLGNTDALAEMLERYYMKSVDAAELSRTLGRRFPLIKTINLGDLHLTAGRTRGTPKLAVEEFTKTIRRMQSNASLEAIKFKWVWTGNPGTVQVFHDWQCDFVCKGWGKRIDDQKRPKSREIVSFFLWTTTVMFDYEWTVGLAKQGTAWLA